ncbi:unnamed protein product [Ectocarpus sp. 4 AP-2014]
MCLSMMTACTRKTDWIAAVAYSPTETHVTSVRRYARQCGKCKERNNPPPLQNETNRFVCSINPRQKNTWLHGCVSWHLHDSSTHNKVKRSQLCTHLDQYIYIPMLRDVQRGEQATRRRQM